ncbi:acetyltransferase, partial [Microbacterium sp. ZW CA_36]
RLRVLGVATAGALVLAGTGAALAAAPDESSAEAAVRAGREALAQAMRDAPPAPIAPTPADTAPAASADVPGDQITAIGDSVMLASAGGLVERLPGVDVDAEVSRSMWAGPRIVDDLAATGSLRPYVVVALGTNGPVDHESLEHLADSVGPQRGLVLVNAYAPRDWIPGVNAELAAFAEDHRNVAVADWSGAIAPHEDLLAGDRIHPGASGGRIFADTVAAAVDELAEERRTAAADRAERLDQIFSADLTP